MEFDAQALLTSISRLLILHNKRAEMALLVNAEAHYTYDDYYDHGGYVEGRNHFLALTIPLEMYERIDSDITKYESSILDECRIFVRTSPDHFVSVKITPKLESDGKWKQNAVAWLMGDRINNQGRVRSDNIAPLAEDGLWFRSDPEICLYKAIKSTGLPFAPLPVFIRGGETYRRIEPDFVIVNDGMVFVAEIHGTRFHQETPAEAQERIKMLELEGAQTLYVPARDCDTLAKATAYVKGTLIPEINKRKAARR